MPLMFGKPRQATPAWLGMYVRRSLPLSTNENLRSDCWSRVAFTTTAHLEFLGTKHKPTRQSGFQIARAALTLLL